MRAAWRGLAVAGVMLAWCACANAQARAGGAQDPLDQLPSFGTALVRMVVTLAVVLGLGIGLLWLLRRRTGLGARGGGKGALRVVESCSLAPGHAVHLVQVGDQFVLVASSQSGVRSLSDVMLDNDALLTHYDKGASSSPLFAAPPAQPASTPPGAA